ncbi:MAG: F0F1 ATP synthase subunit B [Hyphomicrobiaceae bacterium]
MLENPAFWVAVSFFGFLALLAYLKVPAMLGKSLDERADGIRKELDQARRLREEAQDLLADYQMKQRQAEEDAKSIVEQARREADAMKVESERALKESLDRRAKIAEEKIARAEAQAVAEVRAAAVELATSAAQKVLAQRAAGPVGQTLLDQSIRDLKGKLN